MSNEEHKKVSEQLRKVEDIKQTMLKNVKNAALRGEKIEAIEKKSEQLEKDSQRFLDGTRNLKWKMCKSQWKLLVILFLFIILVSVIVYFTR